MLRCYGCKQNTTNKLKDGTKKRIQYYSCANFRNKGATVCHANSIRADVAEGFVLDLLRDVIMFSENLSNIIDQLNKQLHEQRKPWELERQAIEKELIETQAKIDRWKSLLMTAPELAGDLEPRIDQLEVEYYGNKHRLQELNHTLNFEGDSIKKSDSQKVMKLVNALIEDADSKKTTKAILKTFIDRITFDKETKRDYKIYMKFDQAVVNRLNEFMAKESSRIKCCWLFYFL